MDDIIIVVVCNPLTKMVVMMTMMIILDGT